MNLHMSAAWIHSCWGPLSAARAKDYARTSVSLVVLTGESSGFVARIAIAGHNLNVGWLEPLQKLNLSSCWIAGYLIGAASRCSRV